MTSHNASYAKLSPIQGCFFDTRFYKKKQFYITCDHIVRSFM